MIVRSRLDDTSLAVDVDGEGPALVLLHPFPLDRHVWDPFVAPLAARARVIRPDLRGCGDSGVPRGPYLMSTLAADLSDVLDALGVAGACIVGHSLGGYVAYAFFRLFGERVTGLGLVESRASADDPAAATSRRELADRIEEAGMAAYVDATLTRYFGATATAREPALARRLRDRLLATDPRGAAALLRGMAERDPSDDLFEEIAVPTLVVTGSEDALASPAELRRDALAIPGAEYLELASGHLPQWEAPETLLAALVSLLDRVARA